jgi:hypothetical protein
MASESSVLPFSGVALAMASARARMKGLFIKKSACCGTVVLKRCGLWLSGLAKSNIAGTLAWS